MASKFDAKHMRNSQIPNFKDIGHFQPADIFYIYGLNCAQYADAESFGAPSSVPVWRESLLSIIGTARTTPFWGKCLISIYSLFVYIQDGGFANYATGEFYAPQATITVCGTWATRDILKRNAYRSAK